MTTFSHLALTVADLERIADFYRHAFDFAVAEPYAGHGRRLSRTMGVPDARIRGVFLRKDGFFLELLAYASAHRLRPLPLVDDEIGFCHLSFVVDDMDEAERRVTAHGGRLCDGTRTDFEFSGGGSTTIAFCTDPEGNRIELIAHRDAVSREGHGAFLGADALGWPFEGTQP